MTEEQKALIRDIAFEAADTIGRRLEDKFDAKMALHIANCPIARAFEAQQNQTKGENRVRKRTWALLVGIGAAVISGVTLLFEHRDQIAAAFNALLKRG